MGKREDNKRIKRDRIEEAGLKWFLDQGYDRASIEHIVADADVARGTYYLYFADKKALFEALVDRFFSLVEELLTHVGGQIAAARSREEADVIYQEMGNGLALIALTHQSELLLAFRETRASGEQGQALRERENRLVDIAVAFTEEGVRKGFVHVQHPRVVVLVIIGAVEKLYHEFLLGRELGAPQTLVAEVVQMFLTSMRPEKP